MSTPPDDAGQGGPRPRGRADHDSGLVDTGAPTDELLRRARAGDSDALEILFARNIGHMRSWAHGKLPAHARDMLDTGDLVQETFLKVIKILDGFEARHDQAFQAYLRTALKNRLRDLWRQAPVRPAVAPYESADHPVQQTQFQALEETEWFGRYNDALQSLKATDRAAIVLRVDLGGSYKEIAAFLKVASPDAARMKVRRALKRLAQAARSQG